MKAHRDFHNILTQEMSDFSQPLSIDLPNFFEEIELKDQHTWKDEISNYLPLILDVINDEEEVLKRMHQQLGRIFKLEYAVKDIIHNAETHAKSGYMEHFSKVKLLISWAK